MNRLLRISRGWLLFHQDTLGGLGIAFAIAIVSAVVCVSLLIPTGPFERMVGVVTALGVQETDLGSHGIITIRSGNTFYSIRTPARDNCRVGDRIEFDRAPHWWGYTAGVSGMQRRVCFHSPLPQQ